MMPCDACRGTGLLVAREQGWRYSEACPKCAARGTLPTTPQEVKKRAAVLRSERLTSALHPVALIIVTLPPKEASA
jgi:DnaJ-class molecular chaperone